jgi:phage terminase large subunit-like protein
MQDFFLWFIMCGRGFGKSWTGSSWINEGAERATGEFMGLLGRDAHDVRAFMIEGDSGILRTARNDFYPKYEPSKRLITWPNGVKANIFYAEEPNTVRGPNNFRAWVDEPASFQDALLGLKGPNGEDTAMSNLLMTLRIGSPQLLVTGTPKPLKLIRDLLKYEGLVLVRGGTRENKMNLSQRWLKEMETTYEGTRLGKQELDGEVLDDNPGALWQRSWVESSRTKDHPLLERIGVGIDPSVSSGSESAEAGIITAGRWWHPVEERYHFYVLEDSSLKDTPKGWAQVAVNQYNHHKADFIVAERNNGGEMVELTIKTVGPHVNVSTVWASRGKHVRAEPISSLYEQGRVHHVGDPKKWEELEDQLCNWAPGMDSPDRLDALVWILTELNESTYMEEDNEGYEEFFRR